MDVPVLEALDAFYAFFAAPLGGRLATFSVLPCANCGRPRARDGSVRRCEPCGVEADARATLKEALLAAPHTQVRAANSGLHFARAHLGGVSVGSLACDSLPEALTSLVEELRFRAGWRDHPDARTYATLLREAETLSNLASKWAAAWLSTRAPRRG